MVQPFVRGLDKANEERVRAVGLAQKFRMRLGGDEVRVRGDLNHLHQLVVRRSTTNNESGALEGLAVGVIELVAVAMALRDDLLAVKTLCQ